MNFVAKNFKWIVIASVVLFIWVVYLVNKFESNKEQSGGTTGATSGGNGGGWWNNQGFENSIVNPVTPSQYWKEFWLWLWAK